jgi:hypothetical protein
VVDATCGRFGIPFTAAATLPAAKPFQSHEPGFHMRRSGLAAIERRFLVSESMSSTVSLKIRSMLNFLQLTEFFLFHRSRSPGRRIWRLLELSYLMCPYPEYGGSHENPCTIIDCKCDDSLECICRQCPTGPAVLPAGWPGQT